MVNKLDPNPDELRAQILELVGQYYDASNSSKTFLPERPSVPVSGRVYDVTDMRSLVDSALDFWLTTGRFNTSFEKQLSAYLGVRHSMTVNSGSSANLIAVSALTSHTLKRRALQPNDEIITCATGFPTTVNPILLYGLIPVFVDVDIPTYNIDVCALEAAITDKTRGVVIAHTLGNPFDVSKVKDLCEQHHLWLIEDCCDALGARVDGQHVGTFGDIGTLSFYPAHHITMGEGGAVFTNNNHIAKAMESFRDWGRDCYCEPGKENTCNKRFNWKLGDLPRGYDHKYIYSHLGFNLKITDMQAAVGLAQLKHLPQFIETRNKNFNILFEGFRALEKFFILPKATLGSEPSWFGFPLTLRDDVPFTRDELVIELNQKNIGTRLLFGGNLVRQPYMSRQKYKVSGTLKNSNIVVDRTFWIGVYPELTQAHLDYVLDAIESFTNKF